MKKIMSSWSLKSDAREYKSLSRKNRRNFSSRRYSRICKLEEKAYNRLQELEGDEMEITSKNIKAWVSYIQAFSSEKYKSRLYKKLQPYANFDVKQYAEMQELSWFERIMLKLFPEDKNKPLYLNAKQMKKSMNEYRRADRLLQRNP